MNSFIKEIVEELNKQNFTEIFPGYNFNEILPELPITEYGHPNIDYEKYYIDFNDFHYIDFSNEEKTFQNIFENSYLDLINVFHTLHDLNISSKVDKSFIGLINAFVGDDVEIIGDLDENTIYSPNIDDNNNDYDSPAGIEDLDDDESSFTLKEKFNKLVFGRSKNNVYKNNIQDNMKDRTKPINDEDNKKFEKFTSKDFYEYFKNYKFYKTEDNNISFNREENKFKTKNATLIVEINK